MGVVDLTANSATYIGDVSPYLPRGGVAGHRPVGLGDGRVHPLRDRASASAGSSAAAPRSSSTSATTSRTASTTRRRRSVILFVEGFKRPERFLALADRALELGKPIMAVKVGRERAGPGRGRRPLAGRWRARRGSPTRPSTPPGVIRCADLDELLETAELVEGMRRTGRRRRPRPDRGRDRLDRRGVAHRRPRAADRRRPAADPGGRPRRRSSSSCRRWATSAIRSIRGAPPTRRSAYGAASRRWPRRARTTSWSSSTTSRTDRCRPRSRPRNEVTRPLLAATASARASCRSTSR